MLAILHYYLFFFFFKKSNTLLKKSLPSILPINYSLEKTVFHKKALITVDYGSNFSINPLLFLYLKNFKWRRASLSLNWEYSKFLNQISHSFLKFKTSWYFINIKVFQKQKNFSTIWYKFYQKKLLTILPKSKLFFLNLFIQLFYFRDTKTLIPFFQKWLLDTPLKKHKRIFHLINFFFLNWFNLAFEYRLVKGYSLFFKGKLAKKGSVRKSKFFVKNGYISFTNKRLRLNYETYIVWTFTGSVGAGISIFF